MTKRTFVPYRIESLTGGINTRDYASEIEEKQSVDLVNWNFEGNKLVSGKGIDRVYNSAFDLPIQGMTIDGKDIWHIEGGSLYENGELLYPANSYILTVGNIDGEVFSMTIEGTDYTFKFGFFGNEEDARTDFETELQTILPSGTYSVAYVGSGVYEISRLDSGAMTFSNPNLVREITLSDWGEEAKISITIDATTTIVDGETYPNANDALDYVISQLPGSTYLTNDASGSVVGIARIDAVVPAISSAQYDRYTYKLGYRYTDTPASSQYLESVNTAIEGLDYKYFTNTTNRVYKGYEFIDNLIGTELTTTTPALFVGATGTIYKGFEFTTLSSSKFVTATKHSSVTATKARLTDGVSTLEEVTFVGDVATFTTELTIGQTYNILAGSSGGSYVSYVTTASETLSNYINIPAGTINNFVSIGTKISIPYTVYDTTVDNTYGNWSYLNIKKTDYTSLSISRLNTYTDSGRFPDDTFASSLVTTNHKASIAITTFTEVSHVITDDTGLGLISDDFYDITVSSYGILIVSKRGFAPIFIDTDGVATEISASVAGEPTVGTIYNGKIILGGYEGKDTIIFSKTEDPVTEKTNLIDFSAYSAGGQSVSGGNKGAITGMTIGENGLYIFKNNEVWYTNTEKDTGTSFNFIFKKITSNGAVNQGSVSEVEQEIFFFDYINRAVRRLGYEQNLTTLRDVSISREIQELFQSIPDDDEDGDERYSNLITTNYEYPYFTVRVPTSTSPYFYLSGADNNFKYRLPNVTAIYNTENKSWTTKTDTDSLGVLHSHKGYVGTEDGDIYKDNYGNTAETGDSLSKEYVHGDDIRWKKYGRFDVVGKIIPEEGQEKTFTIDVVIDDEIIESRSITVSSTTQIKEKIDLYDIGQKFQFKLGHTGQGKVEIFDVTLYDKVTNISPQDYS